MKKNLLLLAGSFLLVSYSNLNAQCGGKVLLDTSASAVRNSNNFTIFTRHPNELIVISYDGGGHPGIGPVTVDGNPATYIATAWDGNNSGVSEIYAYTASAQGKHTILCTETNYIFAYLNFAAGFYTSTNAPLKPTDITAIKTDSVRCLTGGSIKDSINTTQNNSMVYCDAIINTGNDTVYPVSWTGATFLDSMHVGNGYDASTAYTSASTPGKYIVTAQNSAPANNGCGGISMAMVVISPPSGAPVLTLYSTPDTGSCSGTATATVIGVPPYTYHWTGGQTTAAISGLCAGTYCCKVIDSGGCSDSSCISVITHCPSYTSSICYVTADTNSKHNIVVWQKGDLDSNIVDSFIVYRGVASNIYAKIGEVSIHNYSEYIDTSSFPDVSSYFYKIGIVDTCHGGVPLSAYHQSILLQSSLGIGHKINLNWNFYQGATVNYYRIMRDDSGKGKWHVLDSVPGGINAYTDTAAPLNPALRYRLGLNWNVNCSPYIPRMLSHSPGRLSVIPSKDEAYSNISIANVAGLEPLGLMSSQINVYPNPANGLLNITINGIQAEADFYLTDILGQVVYSDKQKMVNEGFRETINIESLPSGVYFLDIESNGQRVVKKVSKL